MRADDQVMLVCDDPAELLTQGIICFDAGLITL